ncbi:hypothetical protein SAMN05216516_11524 [Izhakiella capsodis]|uniref:Uncharacterized protein n=1 Tax=Izhakiella capsodis TaxID=1367852 RepID=A0A1I5B926_9GAMM|nr:hypothetical protein SAMN05216516_11524 [Izhakiella capsodis]
MPAHGGERVRMSAQLPLFARPPGYREATAPLPSRRPATWRTAYNEERSNILIPVLSAAVRSGPPDLRLFLPLPASFPAAPF